MGECFITRRDRPVFLFTMTPAKSGMSFITQGKNQPAFNSRTPPRTTSSASNASLATSRARDSSIMLRNSSWHDNRAFGSTGARTPSPRSRCRLPAQPNAAQSRYPATASGGTWKAPSQRPSGRLGGRPLRTEDLDHAVGLPHLELGQRFGCDGQLMCEQLAVRRERGGVAGAAQAVTGLVEPQLAALMGADTRHGLQVTV